MKIQQKLHIPYKRVPHWPQPLFTTVGCFFSDWTTAPELTELSPSVTDSSTTRTSSGRARFLAAKDGHRTAIEAAKAVLAVAIPQLLQDSQTDREDVTFTPVVRSKERTAPPSGPLAILAQHCAAQWGGQFALNLLSKDPHESLHWPRKTVSERIEILEAANFASSEVGTPRVIIVDDLITSGLTLSYSAGAIKTKNPEVKVFGLALGKHENLWNLEDNLRESPNRHIPAEWNQIWATHDRR